MKAEWNSSTIVAGRYEIRRLVGRGGMGAVYEAFDQTLNKTVAIKAMHGEIDASHAQRFQLEATATGRLKHRNIVTVMDFGLTDGNQMYMVSEFVQGSTLADIVKNSGPLSINAFLSIFKQICQGMKHAHDAGIVHRDLKPENIIVVNEADGPLVKIVDFGLAKFLDLDGSLTRTGASLGSPYYMSPEQVTAADIDHRSDIYSLGCVMFFCLEGGPPFKGSTAVATMQSHREDLFPSLTELDTDTEHGAMISSMISGCVEKDPENRLSSMSKLLDILETIEPIEETDEKETVDAAEPDGTNAAKRRRVIKRITIATLTVACLLLIMTAGLIFSAASKYIEAAIFPPESPRVVARPDTAELKSSQVLELVDSKITPKPLQFKSTNGKFGEEQRGLWLNTDDITATELKNFLDGEKKGSVAKLQISEQHLSPEMIQVLVNSDLAFLEFRDITFEPGSLSELHKMPNLDSLRLALQHQKDYEFVSELGKLRYLLLDGTYLEEQSPFVLPRLPKTLTDVGLFRFRNSVSETAFEQLKTLPELNQIDLFEVKHIDEERLASQLTSFKHLTGLVIKRVFIKGPPKISGLKLIRLVVMYEPIWTVKTLTKMCRDNQVRNLVINESNFGETFDDVEYLFAVVPSLKTIQLGKGTFQRPGSEQQSQGDKQDQAVKQGQTNKRKPGSPRVR
jgi:Serine/threonine protein kinase